MIQDKRLATKRRLGIVMETGIRKSFGKTGTVSKD